jgi:hypothetical protein
MKPELIEVVRKLREIESRQHAYINKLPADISGAVFDNEYSNLQGYKFDLVLQALFGDFAEDVYWFLYDFVPGNTPGPHVVESNNTEHTFNSDDDYYDYLKKLT